MLFYPVLIQDFYTIKIKHNILIINHLQEKSLIYLTFFNTKINGIMLFYLVLIQEFYSIKITFIHFKLFTQMQKQLKTAKYQAYYSDKMSEREYQTYSTEVGNKIYFNSGLNKLKKHYSQEQITELILSYLACNGLENEEFSVSKIISESLTKFPEGNFERFGDRNYITKEIKRTYFDANGMPIDVQADAISNTYGVEITVQDIIEFVCQYPKREFQTKADEERQRLIQITFEETGFKFSGKFIGIYQRNFLKTAERISEEVPF